MRSSVTPSQLGADRGELGDVLARVEQLVARAARPRPASADARRGRRARCAAARARGGGASGLQLGARSSCSLRSAGARRGRGSRPPRPRRARRAGLGAARPRGLARQARALLELGERLFGGARRRAMLLSARSAAARGSASVACCSSAAAAPRPRACAGASVTRCSSDSMRFCGLGRDRVAARDAAAQLADARLAARPRRRGRGAARCAAPRRRRPPRRAARASRACSRASA